MAGEREKRSGNGIKGLLKKVAFASKDRQPQQGKYQEVQESIRAVLLHKREVYLGIEHDDFRDGHLVEGSYLIYGQNVNLLKISPIKVANLVIDGLDIDKDKADQLKESWRLEILTATLKTKQYRSCEILCELNDDWDLILHCDRLDKVNSLEFGEIDIELKPKPSEELDQQKREYLKADKKDALAGSLGMYLRDGFSYEQKRLEWNYQEKSRMLKRVHA